MKNNDTFQPQANLNLSVLYIWIHINITNNSNQSFLICTTILFLSRLKVNQIQHNPLDSNPSTHFTVTLVSM